MSTNEQTVLVFARLGVNVEVLLAEGRLIHCGSVGPSIARKVLAGGGCAEVPLWEVRLATDTQHSAELLTDNFELVDPKTRSPLLHALLGERQVS